MSKHTTKDLDLPRLPSDPDVTVWEAAPRVFFARGASVNWTILTEGDSFTLIDTGYPADAATVQHSIEAVANSLGGLSLEAILITHAHTDHIGSLAHFAMKARMPVPVLASVAEAPHVRREFVTQVSLADIVKNAYRPGVIPWAVHAIRAGGLKDVGFDGVETFELDVPLDVPGNPIARASAGHTRGHAIFQLPQHGLIVTGDALVSGHPTSKTVGPQTLLPMFNDDENETVLASRWIRSLDADVFLPGHGPAALMPGRAV